MRAMRASELIKQLQARIGKVGDYPLKSFVYSPYYGLGDAIGSDENFAEAFCEDCPACKRDNSTGIWDCPAGGDFTDGGCRRADIWKEICGYIEEIESILKSVSVL